MNVTVNNLCLNKPQDVNFKGHMDKTQNGNLYWKTSAGTTAGAVVSTLGLLHLQNLYLPTTVEELKNKTDKIRKKIEKTLEKHPDNKHLLDGFDEGIKEGINDVKKAKTLEKNKFAKKMAIPATLTAIACSIGCGMIVDNLRNNKARKTADYAAKVGLKKAIMERDDISVSSTGKAYYNSTQGLKYGALLGAGCGLIHNMLGNGRGKMVPMLTQVITFALGGLMMGAIADSNTNGAAKTH